MFFLMHMVTLYTLSVFSGASAVTHYSCNAPLLSTLPHSSFQSSSQSSVSYAAHNAKLNRRDGAGGWSPMVTDQEPWLQVDLREQMEVTAVATQGRYDSWDWVSSYLLLYSDTGRAWKQYRHEDGVGRFVGNVNSEAVVQNKLSHPVRTRFLRFVPLEWNSSGWMGLRLEAYGCSYKSYVADFDGRSSLLYRFNQKSMSTVKDVISLRFKSNQAEGVLLHGEGQRGDYITLELHRGRLDLYLNLDDSRLRFSSGRVAVTVGSLLDDQQWHSVHMERFNKQVNLTVDSHTQHFQTKGEGHSLEVDYELSFGGIPLPGKPGTFLRKNFHGCMENLYYNGMNVIDLAKRRKPQIHSVGNVTFSCSQPQLVACTFLSSSSSFLSLPSAASATGGFSVRFQFRTWNPDGLLLSVQLNPEPHRLELQISNSQLQLTLHSSGRPKSEVSADGSPLTWWLDWEGEKRSYWGGFLPGVQQCSCSLEENCIDMNYFCNCDADADAWANDSGILSYKDHLPVSQIVIGDTNRTGSQAVYHVGPLRCYGDKSIWNAASFYQESSYLYFPTLQGELASDISFYFKTSAPSGVFLENQGLKDFIRVELSSPSVVTFSFDVGNGPAVLSMKSHLPLNDRQWHSVRAERNAKEASLQVDQLPLRFLEAPADGHLRLRLSSQLFVGGTASQQRGFLGCIRTLTVNGVSFDLEERAKMTPGVTSGCPGYCSGSSSLCHNRGRCIEKSNGYVCDCSQSAYGGTTCDQEVSVSFDTESSVTYTFQEPFSVMQNRSSQASSVSTESSSRAREDVAFSFVTSQRPAMLLTVSTFSQQYIAVILAKNGSLQIWYHLQTDRSPDVFSPVLTNLADGRLHRIRIHRVGKNLYVQIDQDIHRKYTLSSDAELILIRSLTLGKVTRRENLNEEVMQAASKGFIGCLSSVQFNHVAPLKAALTNRGSSLVTIRGPLVQSNCGALAESTSHTLQDQTVTANEDKEQHGSGTQKDLAVIAGVVTAVVFIAVCALAVISRLLYQQRRAQRSSSIKEEENRHSMYTDYRTELHLQNTVRDNMKEYYI
ncbi:contactin-associated protein-like 5 [Cottoperca gobio]|uniref:Contactin-associated protein-like 5 n=1 Tax=Cottoperca gobio TaxID=56716 RepID=A0A6J2RWH8_COTGO|nr:contactin-associated protein-like 5 [Cottoperca gobio]